MASRTSKQGKGAAERAAKRKRNWATVVYPESAPENWRDVLSDLHTPVFISPLHDRDINPDGSLKKKHWHVMLMFEGVKSVEQVEQIFSQIGGVGHEIIQSIRGYARYLCHLDNPEKAQYDTGEVTQLGGADYFETINLPTDKFAAIREMQQFVLEHNITSYADLLDYSAEHNYDWFRCLCTNGTYVLKEYIKAHSWRSQQHRKSESLVEEHVEEYADDVIGPHNDPCSEVVHHRCDYCGEVRPYFDFISPQDHVRYTGDSDRLICRDCFLSLVRVSGS